MNKDCPAILPGAVKQLNDWLLSLKAEASPYVLPVFELHGLTVLDEISLTTITGTRAESLPSFPAGMYVEIETKGRILLAQKEPLTYEERLEHFVTEYVARHQQPPHLSKESIPIAGGLFSTFLADHIRKFGWGIMQTYFDEWGFFQSAMASLGLHFDPRHDVYMISTQLVQSDESHVFNRVEEYIRFDHPDPPPLSQKPTDLSPFDALADGNTHIIRLPELNVLKEIYRAMRDDRNVQNTLQMCARPEIITEALHRISDQNMMELLRDLEEEKGRKQKKKKKSKKKRKEKACTYPEWNMWNSSWYDPIEESLRVFFLRTCHPNRYSIF